MKGKVTKDQMIYVPCKCPRCGADLEWNGTDLVCYNENETGLAYHFFTVVAPVDNAGWSTYSSIIDGIDSEDKLVNFIANMDINSIVDRTNGSATKEIVRKICETVKSEIDPARFLVACNIKGLGWNTCSAIIEAFPEFINEVKEGIVDWDKLYSVNGVGWKTVVSITAMSDRIKNLAKVVKIKSFVKEEKKEVNFKVAITGALSIKRSDFDALLSSKGIEQSGNFKELKYLITNTPDSGSSKNRKAREYGVEIISEEDFRKLYLND